MYTSIVDAEIVNEHLGDPAWVVVDCRFDLTDTNAGYRDYLASHIPKAVYADLDKDLSGSPVTDHGRHPMPAPDRINRLFSRMGIGNIHQVVVYDASYGSIAARLWWMLIYMGHERVAVLDGGWQAWQKCGFETEQGEWRNPEKSFNGSPGQDMLVLLNQVEKSPLLIDSREPERFRGEHEPIDPAAGHIPGAINHHWKLNVDADGMFLAPDRLKAGFLDDYSGTQADEVVFYCGSGVTACQNILAVKHAGLPLPRLYAGSWSEWCSDQGRPVATGDD